MGIVYLVTDMTDHRSYVGYAKSDLEAVKDKHIGYVKAESSTELHKAMREHGWKKFRWVVLFRDPDPVVLIRKAKYYIREYQTEKPNGVDDPVSTIVAEPIVLERKRKTKGPRTYRHTEEAKRKISEAAKRRIVPPFSEEHRMELSKRAQERWKREKAFRALSPEEQALIPLDMRPRIGKPKGARRKSTLARLEQEAKLEEGA